MKSTTPNEQAEEETPTEQGEEEQAEKKTPNRKEREPTKVKSYPQLASLQSILVL
jgi:hypothetical protein